MGKKERRVHKKEENIVGDRFRVSPSRKLGSGSFGDIFRCIDLDSKKYFAAKIETRHTKFPQLHVEHNVYKKMASHNGFPRVHWCGTATITLDDKKGPQKMNIMVLTRLGLSLEKLFNMCQRKFDIKTVCMIGIQLANRLESLHKAGYIHRDIKPDNFLVGAGDRSKKDGSVIHMIDMGLAKAYQDTAGRHIPMTTGKRLTGTPRYASIHTHRGLEQSRRDDCESMCYVLIYFLKGRLPWQGIKAEKPKKYKKIQECKERYSAADLCEGLPEEFTSLLEYCRKIEFETEPDYKYMKKLMQLCCQMRYIVIDWRFAWQITEEKKTIKPSDKETSQSENPPDQKLEKVNHKENREDHRGKQDCKDYRGTISNPHGQHFQYQHQYEPYGHKRHFNELYDTSGMHYSSYFDYPSKRRRTNIIDHRIPANIFEALREVTREAKHYRDKCLSYEAENQQLKEELEWLKRKMAEMDF